MRTVFCVDHCLLWLATYTRTNEMSRIWCSSARSNWWIGSHYGICTHLVLFRLQWHCIGAQRTYSHLLLLFLVLNNIARAAAAAATANAISFIYFISFKWLLLPTMADVVFILFFFILSSSFLFFAKSNYFAWTKCHLSFWPTRPKRIQCVD